MIFGINITILYVIMLNIDNKKGELNMADKKLYELQLENIVKAIEHAIDDDKAYLEKEVENINKAIAYKGDNMDEKGREQLLQMYTYRILSQAVFHLFRINNLPEEIATFYREHDYSKMTLELEKEISDKIADLNNQIFEEQKKMIDIDILKALLGGMSEEEAKQKVKNYYAPVK